MPKNSFTNSPKVRHDPPRQMVRRLSVIALFLVILFSPMQLSPIQLSTTQRPHCFAAETNFSTETHRFSSPIIIKQKIKTDQQNKRLDQTIQERFVPVQEVAEQLPKEWQPLKRTDYLKLRKAIKPIADCPRMRWIDHAHYAAELDVEKEMLRHGELTLTIKQSTEKSALLRLDPLNLALTKLSWKTTDSTKEKRAVWGITNHQQLAVQVASKSGTLKGHWSLKGKRIGERIDFNVQLPTATVSQFQLIVPAGWIIESSAGQVTGPIPVFVSGKTLWRVNLGSRTSCRLKARRPLQITPTESTVLVESEITHTIQADRIQVRGEFRLNVSGVAARSATFLIPRQLNVYSVLYAGRQELSYRTTRAPKGMLLLHVQFLNAIQGKSRLITVQAIFPIRPNRKFTVPQMRLIDGTFLSGKVHLHVGTPLTIKSLNFTGLRQISPLALTATGQVTTFSQWTTPAKLEIRVGQPVPQVSTDVTTYLDLTKQRLQLISQTVWTVKNGSTFAVKLRVPTRWKIQEIQVRAHRVDPKATSEPLPKNIPVNTSFEQEKNGEQFTGARLLTIDLPNALTPKTPISITITASRVRFLNRKQVDLPVLTPIASDAVEHLLGIQHYGHVDTLKFSDPAWKQLQPSEISVDVKKITIFPKAGRSNELPMTFWSSKSLSNTATFSLDGRKKNIFHSAIWTMITVNQSQIHERSIVTVTPYGSKKPVAHLFVYLTSSSHSSSWSLQGNKSKNNFSATRLPLARHSEWALPSTGELWEIWLKQPQSKQFQLLLDRDVHFSEPVSSGLAFVLDTQILRGTIEVISKNETQPTITVKGAHAVVDREAELKKRLKFGPTNAASLPAGRLWNYRSITDQLQLTPPKKQEIVPTNSTAAFHLRSILSAANDHDLHVGTFRLSTTPTLSQFNFTFSSSDIFSETDDSSTTDDSSKITTSEKEQAVLVDVYLNGLLVHPLKNGRTYTVQPLPANRVNEITIRYRTASSAISLRRLRTVTVPQTALTLTEFHWEFALPPHLSLAAQPSRGSLIKPLDQPTWTQRYFGPLGRSQEKTVFNPFLRESWKRFFTKSENSTTTITLSNSSTFPSDAWKPDGWKTYQLTAATLTEAPVIDIYNHVTTRRIAWGIFACCLITGILLRRLRTSRRNRIAVFWLSFCFCLAWGTPPIYAEIAGSGLIGAMIAILIPRKLLLWETLFSKTAPQIPIGSTIAFSQKASSIISLIFIGITTIFFTTTFPFKTAQANGTAHNLFATSIQPVTLKKKTVLSFKTETVIVPIEKKHGTSQPAPIVYLHKDLLKKLREQAAHRQAAVSYMIRSASYRAQVSNSHSAIIEAKLQVDVLDSKFPVQVQLPFKDVKLAGATACKLNGQIQPVRRAENGSGFSVDLTKPPVKNTEATPLISPVESFQIQLKFHVPVVTKGSQQQIAFGMPLVAANQLFFDFDEFITSATIRTMQGTTVIRPVKKFPLDKKSSISTTLERTDQLRIAWSSKNSPPQITTEAKATVLEMVNVHPTFLEYHIRAHYQITKGTLEIISWNLPRGSLVQKVSLLGSSNGIERNALLPNDDGTSQLQMEFTEPQQETLIVEAVVMIPLLTVQKNRAKQQKKKSDTHTEKTSIPVLDLFANPQNSQFASKTKITVDAQYLGIQTAPELELHINQYNKTAITRVTEKKESLIQKQTPLANLLAKIEQTPKHLFQIQQTTDLPYQLTLRKPKRTVRKKQTGYIRDNQIEWIFQAELETTIAPVLLHRLYITPQLRIESISVIQNDAPRLAHWSRIGSQLLLFLSNKTTEPQTITIHATLPFQKHGELQLPDIHFVADTANHSKLLTVEKNELLLDRDADVFVEIVNPDSLEIIDDPQPSRHHKNHNRVTIGMFRYRSDPDRFDPVIPRIRMGRRSEKLHVETLTQLKQQDADNWNISTTIQFRETVVSQAGYQLQLPPEFAKSFQIFPATIQHKITRHDNGSATVILYPLNPYAAESTVHIRSTVPFPQQREWNIPKITVVDATIQNNFLSLGQNIKKAFAVSSANKQIVQYSPDWAQKQIKQFFPAGKSTTFTQPQLPWRITRKTFHTADQQNRLPLMETQTWLSKHSQQYGQTKLILLGKIDNSLLFDLPEDVALRAAVVNGKSIDVPVATDQQFAIPLQENRNTQTIILHWSRNISAQWLPLRKQSLSFPKPHSLSAEKSLLTIMGQHSSQLIAPTGIQAINSVEYHLDRFNGLLIACEADYKINRQRPPLWKTISQINTELKRYFQKTISTNQSINQQTVDLLKKRFQEIDERFLLLKRHIQRLPIPTIEEESLLQSMTMPSIFDETTQHWHGRWDAMETEKIDAGTETATQAISFWSVNRSVLLLSVALILFLIIKPIVKRVLQLETGELVARRISVSFAVTGLVWWLCLTPSIFGMLLIIAAGIQVALRKFQTTNSEANSDQSFHLSE